MTPLEFLKTELGKLALNFPSIKIKYAHNYISDLHIVELTPQYDYYHNEELDNAWVPLSVKFRTLFNGEDIVFVSSDSILKVDNPELEWNTEVDIVDLAYYNDCLAGLSRVLLKFDFPSNFEEQPFFLNQRSGINFNFITTELTQEPTTIVTFKETKCVVLQQTSIVIQDDNFSLAA